MPRQTQKRTQPNPLKPRLLFLEQPRNGPRHDCGNQVRSAINPRTFTPEEESIGVSHWVSPQFSSLEDTAVRRVGRGRKTKNQKKGLSSNTMDATSSLSLPQVRTACKYPALTFGVSGAQRHHKTVCKPLSCAGKTQKAQNVCNSQGNCSNMISPNNQNDVPKQTSIQTPHVTQREYKTTTEARATPCETVKTPLCFTVGKPRTPASVHTPETNTFFTPPHIETPKMVPSVSSSFLHLVFSPNQSNTPPPTQTSCLLVKDSPERDYGLKVTWRKRKSLMKLLIERGKLLVNETMISNSILK